MITTTAGNTGSNAPSNSNRSALSNEFHDLIADIEDLVKETASLGGEELKLARAKLAALLESAKSSADDMGKSVSRQARKSVAATNDYVHEQPWKAIGVAATVGLLLGFVLARR